MGIRCLSRKDTSFGGSSSRRENGVGSNIPKRWNNIRLGISIGKMTKSICSFLRNLGSYSVRCEVLRESLQVDKATNGRCNWVKL